MATPVIHAIALSFLIADAPATLRPTEKAGESTRIVIELKGEGLFKAAAEDGAAEKGGASKARSLKVETRLEFTEKILTVGKDGGATKAIRRVERAGAAINGEVRATSATIRPEVATLVAELRDGQVVVVSPGGPLTRAELEVVQGPGDPLALAALLPAAGVAKGESWTVGNDAARSLSGYDTLDDNGLKATLESVDDARAVVRLKGQVRGSYLGGPGTITLGGSFAFDRKAGRVESLEIDRAEVRRPGPVEAGLDIKSTLKVSRRAVATPSELSEANLAGVPTEVDAARELLVFVSPDGKYQLVHDRDWHIDWDGEKQAVLKRLDKGRFVAQCNLSAGPNAGAGRHEDPARLRDDIKAAVGPRFVALVGEGVVDGAPAGGYRYKVAVQGREGKAGVLWYYYLIAGPRGDQVLAIFTLGLDQRERFGDQDLRLIGSFEWLGPAAKP
ncbi:MAG TPA: hypothetical protein VG406_13380 [Isosphaeraceae bacterium]|nr:hypothetical protein [Isosphaeraceae bacterium]